MKFIPALRLTSMARLALVGAGGKTTTLFRLAGEFLESGARSVLVTTTTHLALDEVEKASHHFMVNRPADLQPLQVALPAGMIALTGLPHDDMRVAGLSPEIWDAVCSLADRYAIPLLIEADGSRRKPLKAPAEHEPVIPPWIECVVVVAGLSGLQQPLTAESVHRPEIFSARSGLQPGQPISLAALRQVLAHPAGGLKGIPGSARRYVLLNQADSNLSQAAGKRLAEQLVGVYSGALVASARHPDPVHAVYEKVAAIVLAAGASQRLGQPKQLLIVHGESLVHRAARLAMEAGLAPVVVVTGAQADQVETAIADLMDVRQADGSRAVRIVRNAHYADGQSTSLRAGLQALEPANGAVVFLLVDQPGVSVPLLRALVEKHAQTHAPLVAPLVEDRRANPVCFDRRTFEALSRLQGDSGGRVLFSHYPITYLPWLDDRLLVDIDTLEDYRRWLAADERQGTVS